jgi:hypothetical protein
MNPNQNGIPNVAVPYQSFLLNGVLKNIYFTCSDSIRSGNGSFYGSGNTIGQGVYQVLQGTINYGGSFYIAPAQFAFNPSVLTFTQVGTTPAYVQKIQSIFAGNVYNAGDSLEPGGTYLVEAGILPGGVISSGGIVYNGKTIPIGTYFSYILGADTFEQSDIGANNFVKQVAEDPRIVISFADFFQSIKSFMGGDCAFGQNNGVQFLEQLSSVYQSIAPSIDLGNVPIDWKMTPAIDLMYSNFKVGYADQQYTVTNGFQEVNSTQVYTSGLMLSPQIAAANTYPNELNLISPIRADALGAEQERISQNDTAASRSNNDTWAFWVNPNPTITAGYTYYQPALAADSLTKIYGVVEGYYNFFLSPKQNLLRGAAFLASIFYNMADYPITLASALKNSAMVTVDLNGRRVGESDSFLVSSLGTPAFIPIYYSGKQNIGYRALPILNSNQYAPVKFTVNGVTLKAFISDLKIAPTTDESQDIKLLLAAGNDLTELIRF